VVIPVVKGVFEGSFRRREKPENARVVQAFSVSALRIMDSTAALPNPFAARQDRFLRRPRCPRRAGFTCKPARPGGRRNMPAGERRNGAWTLYKNLTQKTIEILERRQVSCYHNNKVGGGVLLIKWVLWDFNGTLADDLDAAVASVSDMLARRGRPPMTRQRYQELMEVPIVRYYEKLFDLRETPMSVIMPEFQAGYARHFDALAHLADGAGETLAAFRQRGIRQLVLSSFRRDRVEELLDRFGVRHYFESVLAAEDDRCEEKLTRARQWLAQSGAQPGQVLVIGDLLHDYEVARGLDAQCALLCCGHQSKEDLLRTGAPVYDNLRDLYRNYR